MYLKTLTIKTFYANGYRCRGLYITEKKKVQYRPNDLQYEIYKKNGTNEIHLFIVRYNEFSALDASRRYTDCYRFRFRDVVHSMPEM
jgi:hypothetical protein